MFTMLDRKEGDEQTSELAQIRPPTMGDISDSIPAWLGIGVAIIAVGGIAYYIYTMDDEDQENINQEEQQ